MTEYRTIKITPEVAGDMLANNYENNRRVNPRAVKAIAADMRDGRFVSQNGQTIIVTKSGKLIDGQHRLSAIRDSGVALTFLVAIVDDQEERVFYSIDCGKPRRLGQFLTCDNSTNIASLARIAYAVDNGNAQLSQTLSGMLDNRGTRPSIPALKEFVDARYDELRSATNSAQRIYKVNRAGSVAMFGAVIWLLRYLNCDMHVDAFIDDVCALIPEKPISAAFLRYVNSNRKSASNHGEERLNLALSMLYAYDRYCSDGEAQRIITASFAKTRDTYGKLLQMQRMLRNSDIPLYGADNA